MFNIITLDRMKKKKNNPIVGNIGHVDFEIDFARLGVLEGMKVDNIKLEKIVSSSVVMLSSGRLRFLNLGFDTGHLSFVDVVYLHGPRFCRSLIC